MANQVLTFHLAGTEYGVGILGVQEIRSWSAVTRIPNSPAHILGVLNLRGAIVPILDLRVRFGQSDPQMTAQTAIIVLSVGNGSSRRECGLVVDGVSDVIELPPDLVKTAPQLKDGAAASYIEGIATIDDRMLVLLNLDALIGEELLASQRAEESAAAA